GSIALCTGVILNYLAKHSHVQDRLRSGVSTREFDAILDEILRIDDPFVSNRRIVTDTVTVGDRTLRAGDRVILNWTAANRDPRRVQPRLRHRQARVSGQAAGHARAARADPCRP